MNPFVSDADRAQFEEQGYHIIREAISSAEIAMYRRCLADLLKTDPDHAYAKRLMTAEIPGAPPTATNPYCRWAGFDLPLFDEVFFDFAFQEKIALSVAGLLDSDVNLFETSFVAKVPGFPGNYRDWHQDTEYSDPQSNDKIVTVITYLDDQGPESGGTWVCPGTHKLGPLPHQKPIEEYSSNAQEVSDKYKFDAIGLCPEYNAGDTLVFYGRLVHKSGSNLSRQDRLSLAYNFVRKDTVDLREVNFYIGASTPIVRNGTLYRPGQTARARLGRA
jgi:ectoine hydroxylase-related dioxygenase (phytanoyl-CoA dioxygenase family)